MTVLLIITTLGIILLGYAVMYRIDHFMERGGFADSPQGRANQGLLIYGAPELVPRMQRAGVKCKALADPAFPDDGLYAALFALSEDDYKNLAVCKAAKDIDPGIYIVARCGAPELCVIFEITGADRLLGAGEPVDTLLAELCGAGR